MKSEYSLQAIGLSILLVLFIPTVNVSARASTNLPPADMFQLPWEQGAAWVAIDGLDNGTNRPLNSSHNYLYGGAVDFAPHNGMRVGENTSNAWVTAAAAGIVIETSSCHLKIDHGNGWVTEYQFIGNLQVKVGDSVHRNQRLAIIADGLRLKFCQPSPNPDVPHLHFMLRPNIRNATFSGWMINYNSLFNSTTFTKNGQTLGLFKPLLNVVPSLEIVLRGPITWDTVYTGSVDTLRYEKWSFTLTEQTFFSMGAIPTTAGLTPLLLVLDANGNEVIRTTNIFSTTLPAGNYFVQIQPQAGTGSYQLLAQKDGYGSPIPDGPSVSTVVSPLSVNVGASAIVTLNLNNIPAEGYTSAEFTCTYDASVATASNIADAGLFGADAAVAINGPQNGSFIVAVAGSNGHKATGSGAAITFNLTGLRAGWTLITCTARVSKGDNTLVAIPVTPAGLAVLPVDSFPQTATPTPGQEPATATAMPTSIASASPTATSLPTGTGMLTGQVLASKPVGVDLYNADNTLIASVAANADGTFSLTAPPGAYTVVATSAGFLSARGSMTLNAGATGTMPTVSLPAGDIDNNNVIDQFDAMTIAMNYNTAVPAAADLNSDGIINLLDLELLARNYRKAGPLAWQ
jgi:hypothetical protein